MTPNTASPVDAPGIRRPSRFVGDGAAVLLVALACGLIGGIEWGILRPTQPVTFLEGGRLSVGQDGLDATFSALLWFTAIALIAGLALGSLAHNRFPLRRGLGMEAWVGVTAVAMAAVQLVVGNLLAGWRQPALDGVAPGTSVDVLPAFDVPVALLVAPFAAMLAYWCLLFLAPGEDEDDTRPEDGEYPVREEIAPDLDEEELHRRRGDSGAPGITG